MTTDTNVTADLSDLDLLDDANRHARCHGCVPHVEFGVPFIAWCGKRVVWLEDPPGLGDDEVPANACPDCVRLPVCAAGLHA